MYSQIFNIPGVARTGHIVFSISYTNTSCTPPLLYIYIYSVYIYIYVCICIIVYVLCIQITKVLTYIYIYVYIWDFQGGISLLLFCQARGEGMGGRWEMLSSVTYSNTKKRTMTVAENQKIKMRLLFHHHVFAKNLKWSRGRYILVLGFRALTQRK